MTVVDVEWVFFIMKKEKKEEKNKNRCYLVIDENDRIYICIYKQKHSENRKETETSPDS